MSSQHSSINLSQASVTQPIQSLAMCLYGHRGFAGTRTCLSSQPPVAAFIPATLEHVGSIPMPPTPHMLTIVDMEALMLAADIDAGEKHATLSPRDVILNYKGDTGNYDVTWEVLQNAQYLPEEDVWLLGGRKVRLLNFVTAPAPLPFSPYTE